MSVRNATLVEETCPSDFFYNQYRNKKLKPSSSTSRSPPKSVNSSPATSRRQSSEPRISATPRVKEENKVGKMQEIVDDDENDIVDVCGLKSNSTSTDEVQPSQEELDKDLILVLKLENGVYTLVNSRSNSDNEEERTNRKSDRAKQKEKRRRDKKSRRSKRKSSFCSSSSSSPSSSPSSSLSSSLNVHAVTDTKPVPINLLKDGPPTPTTPIVNSTPKKSSIMVANSLLTTPVSAQKTEEGEKTIPSTPSTPSSTTSRIYNDYKRATKLGKIITPASLAINGSSYSLRKKKTGPVIYADGSTIPEGLSLLNNVFLDRDEHNKVVDIVNSVSRDKRSPWSSEGFGGNYQKTYFVTEEQVKAIERHGYNWNMRRMKYQTIFNSGPDQNPGEFILSKNHEHSWPAESLTNRIKRLFSRPGYSLDLLAVQSNWMKGTDFPTHKDRARYEGWGDVIIALSLNSGGDVVFKHPRAEYLWLLNIKVGDVYSMRDEVRWDWEHGFVATDASERISIIWRFREYLTDVPLSEQPTRLDCDV